MAGCWCRAAGRRCRPTAPRPPTGPARGGPGSTRDAKRLHRGGGLGCLIPGHHLVADQEPVLVALAGQKYGVAGLGASDHIANRISPVRDQPEVLALHTALGSRPPGNRRRYLADALMPG